MKTLAIYSNKGGVGKTATAVNISYLAAQSGLSTLICDLDPQSSASYYFRVKPKLKEDARGFNPGGKPISRSIKGTDFKNLDLLPSDFSHRSLDIVFNKFKRPEQQLARVISQIEDQNGYDLMILDCPPSINTLAENIFYAADFIIVPLIPTPLSERTHNQLLKFFQKQNYSQKKIHTFISMEDRRKKMHCEFSESLRSEFGHCLNNTIPYSSDVEKMGIERQPVMAFAPKSKAALSYRQLWAEIYDKLLSDIKATV